MMAQRRWQFIPIASLLLAAVAASIPAKAADDRLKDRSLVIGRGSDSCGQYLLAVEGEKKARPLNPNPGAANSSQYPVYSTEYGVYLEFTDGFLTGANSADATRRFIGQETEHAGRMVWLENYCRANPVLPFIGALIELREYLAGQKR
jgi:hypothetical protein